MGFKILVILIFLFFAKTAYAVEAPIPLSPQNNSTIATIKLEWQKPEYELYPTSHYRIQVDNNSDFGSNEKDYYTTNTYYSPQLDENTWYWRVKAKNATGVWSNWSSSWQFILNKSSATPTPTPTPNPSATAEPAPSSQSSSEPIATFVISNTPHQINSDQSFKASVSFVLSSNPQDNFYLKGAFKKTGSSNYFGLTKVSNDWIKNGSSAKDQLQITTNSAGEWAGEIEIKPDSEDTGFSGSDDYSFKVGRYNSSGSDLTWSNEVNIRINHISFSAQTDQPTPKSTPTKSPLGSKGALPTPTSNPSSKPNITHIITNQIDATIAGEATSSSDSALISNQKNNKSFNIFFTAGIISLLIGAGIPILYYLKHNTNLWRKLKLNH